MHLLRRLQGGLQVWGYPLRMGKKAEQRTENRIENQIKCRTENQIEYKKCFLKEVTEA